MKNIVSNIMNIIRPQNTIEILYRVFALIGFFVLIGMTIGTYELSFWQQKLLIVVIVLDLIFETFQRK